MPIRVQLDKVLLERRMSLTELADRVGVGKGTLYRYFPSKRDLFLAAADRAMRRLREYLDGVATRDDPLDQIAAAIEANGKLKGITNKLQELREQATAQGKPLDRVDKVIAQVAQMRQEFVELALY